MRLKRVGLYEKQVRTWKLFKSKIETIEILLNVFVFIVFPGIGCIISKQGSPVGSRSPTDNN